MREKRKPKTEEIELLLEAVERNAPELIPLVKQLGAFPLSKEQRENIREAVADELVKTGLNKDSEPNERGLLLDDIIGLLGNY